MDAQFYFISPFERVNDLQVIFPKLHGVRLDRKVSQYQKCLIFILMLFDVHLSKYGKGIFL
jgi:hypothetical protein